MQTFLRALHLRTWQIESAVVALVLMAVAACTGNHFREWVGAAAVWITFMHGQVADRLSADQAARPEASVPCWRWAGRYFVTKEILWMLYFILSQTWSALACVVLFLLYPVWRRFYRKRFSGC